MIDLTVRCGSEMTEYAKCDRYAAVEDKYRNKLNFISITGSVGSLQAIMAVFKARKKNSTFEINGHYYEIDDGKWRLKYERFPEHRIGHVIAIAAEDRGVLIGDKAEAFRKWLFSKSITTPVLPEWVPYIYEVCVRAKLIEVCDCYGIDAMRMKIGSGAIDDIVSLGLREKKIQIPNRNKISDTQPSDSGLLV